MSKGSNTSCSRPALSIGDMNIDIALSLATQAHQGQVDKQNVDYIQHPIYLANMFEDNDAKIVAYLHDVLEDTDVTVFDLKQQGISKIQLQTVLALTRTKDITYQQFIDSICTLQSKVGVLARQVKIADIQHHLQRANSQEFESMVKKRYLPAIQKLRQAQQDHQEDFIPAIIEEEQLNI